MKLVAPDILLLIVGGALFVGAGVPLVADLRESGGASEDSSIGLYVAQFAAASLAPETQGANGMDAASLTFKVTAANVTQVAFAISCTDPAGPISGSAPYQVSVTVSGPGGRSGQTSGACGASLRVGFVPAPLPANQTIRASSLEDAKSKVGTDANATKAQGDWTVQITGRRNGQTTPAPQLEPNGAVAMTLSAWQATVTAINPPPQK